MVSSHLDILHCFNKVLDIVSSHLDILHCFNKVLDAGDFTWVFYIRVI